LGSGRVWDLFKCLHKAHGEDYVPIRVGVKDEFPSQKFSNISALVYVL